jgi:hypothetical protein
VRETHAYARDSPLKRKRTSRVVEQRTARTELTRAIVCAFTPQGDEGLAEVLLGLSRNMTVQHIYLNSNGVTVRGAQMLADYFARGTSKLVGLWLGVNRLDDEGVAMVTEAIGKYAPGLQKLCLSSNRFGEEGALAICKNLTAHPSLVYLGLGYNKATHELGELPNNIGDTGAAHVAQWLHDSKTRPPNLRILDVNQNGIGIQGLSSLHDAVLQSPQLINFRFATTPGDDERTRILLANIKEHIARNMDTFSETEGYEFTPITYQQLKHHEWIDNITSNYRNA